LNMALDAPANQAGQAKVASALIAQNHGQNP
jgi:hypothetical protein